MKRAREDRGQSVVEFTLMLPFLLLMLFSLVEMGYALYTQVTINNAASEAARYAAVANSYDAACSDDSIQGRARLASNGLMSVADCAAGVEVRYQQDSMGQVGRGAGVAVQISHQHETITPLPALLNFISGGVIASTWTVGSCSDSRLEAAPGGPTPAGADCS
jgi:Flp pilus assembly protein TadG